MSKACRGCGSANDDTAAYCSQCGESLGVAPGSEGLLGRRVGDGYRLVRLLHETTALAVYSAVQHEASTQESWVRVTLPRTELWANKDFLARFATAAQTVGRLRHPSVVQPIEVAELEEGVPFAVSVQAEEPSLADVLLTNCPLEEERLDKMVLQLCGALHELHQLGMVHRNLSTDVIAVRTQASGHEHFRLSGFLLATEIGPSRRPGVSTDDELLMGSLPYMSPEQFAARPLDARTDVYSMGLILYESVTCRRPFRGGTAWEWAAAHLSEQPEPIPDEALPAQKRDAIMSAVSKSPDDRPSSMPAFLEAFLSGPRSSAPVAAHGPTVPDPPSRTDVAAGRMPEIHPTNPAAFGSLRGAIELGADADTDELGRRARSKRIYAALESIQAIHRAMHDRFVRELGSQRERWRRLLGDRGKNGKGTLGEQRLYALLRRDTRPPSLAVMGGWICAKHPLSPPELAHELREAMGVPAGLEDDVHAAGEVRIVLAHRTEYERDAERPLDAATPWLVRVEDGEIDVPPGTLQWLEWLAESVLQRQAGPRPVPS